MLSLNVGPDPLWLLEDLVRDVPLDDSVRVLDLGCGKGPTSVFLSREFGVEVWAADPWISSEEREAVFRQAASATGRMPSTLTHVDFLSRTDSSTLSSASTRRSTSAPTIICCPRCCECFGPVAASEWQPAIRAEVRELDAIPEHIRSVVGWEALAWHTAAWWEQQWRLGGLVTPIKARFQPNGSTDWLRWERAVLEHGDGAAKPSIEMVEVDGGRLLTFAIVSAVKR